MDFLSVCWRVGQGPVDGSLAERKAFPDPRSLKRQNSPPRGSSGRVGGFLQDFTQRLDTLHLRMNQKPSNVPSSEDSVDGEISFLLQFDNTFTSQEG